MTKTPFITADKLDQITAEFPTPFHLYDEKGIRETARAVNAAFTRVILMRQLTLMLTKISSSWKRLQGFLKRFLYALTQVVSFHLVQILWIILKNLNLG